MAMVEFVLALCLEDGERELRLRKMYPWRFQHDDKVTVDEDLVGDVRVAFTQFDLSTDTHRVYLMPVRIELQYLGETIVELLEAGWVEE